jgi:hypothetical protein
MPKYLPCPTCHSHALATKSGLLHSAGQLSAPTISYICKRCGRPTTLSAPEFELLPEMSSAEITAATCDLPYSALDVPTAQHAKS